MILARRIVSGDLPHLAARRIFTPRNFKLYSSASPETNVDDELRLDYLDNERKGIYIYNMTQNNS